MIYLQPAVKQLPSQYNETTNHNQHSPQKVRLTTTYNHHHKTIQRLVNRHWTRFQTKLNGKPELPRNITMCYRRNPSLRNKLAKTRYIQELATPTNRPTLKPHCANRCWNRKCPTCPNIPTRHQFLSTTLGTTHTTKCNYKWCSTGIVYLVTSNRCHKQYVGQTLGSLHTRLNESRCETQHPT